MGRFLQWLAVVFAFLVSAAPISTAQVEPEQTSITGMVLVGTEDQPAGGVVVNVKSIDSGRCIGVVTDENGEFEADGLAPGQYEVFAEKIGYESTRITTKTLDESGPLKVYLRSHREAGNRADILVSARDPQIPAKAREAFAKGSRCLQNLDYAGSLAHFRRAIQLYPAFYEAYYNLGTVELRLFRDQKP